MAQVQTLGLDPGLPLSPWGSPLQLSAADLPSQHADGTVADARRWLPAQIPRLVTRTSLERGWVCTCRLISCRSCSWEHGLGGGLAAAGRLVGVTAGSGRRVLCVVCSGDVVPRDVVQDAGKNLADPGQHALVLGTAGFQRHSFRSILF